VRPFRFAVHVRSAATAEEWRAKARRIEELGYDTLVMSDHLTPQFATIPGLMAAADATTRLRIGALVLANDYRHPLMLAKEITTMDVLSGGRVDIGIGTGWYVPDYEMLGIALDPPADRVSRLAEAIVLLKRFFTEESVDHRGRWYTAKGARLLPRPLQRPYPPLVIGAGGPVMLRLAARQADIVSIGGTLGRAGEDESWRAQRSRAAFEERLAIVRRAAGDRLGALDLEIGAQVMVTDDPASAFAAKAKEGGVSPDDVAESPYHLYGPVDMLRRLMLERRDRYGISYYRTGEKDMEQIAPLARAMVTT
jgi:probable F420-dependent oxidoreductase